MCAFLQVGIQESLPNGRTGRLSTFKRLSPDLLPGPGSEVMLDLCLDDFPQAQVVAQHSLPQRVTVERKEIV